MQSRLILVEGLPGSGKTTVAQLAAEIVSASGKTVKLFCEGNLNHPADFDGVAYFSASEYERLIQEYENVKPLIKEFTVQPSDKRTFVAYRKLKQAYETEISDELMGRFSLHDIYELPLALHTEIIVENWSRFADSAEKEDAVYVFECCFLQNPVTTTMIRDNASRQVSFDYVRGLHETVKTLNPVLLYVDQKDVRQAFEKAIKERPREWFEGFVRYYTTQGFGRANEYRGLDGTIEILKERKKLELHILEKLNIQMCAIDNSNFCSEETRRAVQQILSKYL